MLNTLHLTIKYIQGILGMNKEDIILASYQKSGSTWVRFFLCNIISLSEWDGKVVDFRTLDSTMPEIGVSNLMKPWPYSSLPRFVKTHKRCWPLFWRNRSVLVIRDPRDVMVSFYHYRTAHVKSPFTGTFSEFLTDTRYGLKQWFEYHKSWKRRCTVEIMYEKLRRDDTAEFSKMFDALGLWVPPHIFESAVHNSRFERVRELERRFGLSKPEQFRPGFLFTRQGKSGNWEEYFSTKDHTFYLRLCDQYNIDMRSYGYI